jgi:response regulator RpfG family c-di-GMP phosphodiesterase
LSLGKIKPHVIISDNRMPHILGIDFLSRARNMNQRSLRILLTGYSYDCENNAHIDKVMQKPWQSDELEFEIANTTVHHDRIIVSIPAQSKTIESRKCSLCGSDSVTHEVRYDSFTECLCEECHVKLDSFTGSYLEPMIMRQMEGNVL